MNFLRAIIFSVGNREFGIDINHVLAYHTISPTMNNSRTSEFMKEISTICRVVTPIIDMRPFFQGDAKNPDSKLTRLFIVQRNEDLVGMVVDSALDVIEISPDILQDFEMNRQFDYYIGTAMQDDREIIILDVQNMNFDLYYDSRHNGFH